VNFFRQKMPIYSNFHFSPNLTGKLNFSTNTQFISLDHDSTQKPVIFNEELPLTIFPIQFLDFFLFSFFPDFIQAISNSQITTIKLSSKKSTQKYIISGTSSQFSHFSVNSYHFSGQFLHIPIDL
jgi:hypothetical protein